MRGTLPVDDNYRAIRGVFWLATDTYYKRATEDITRKRNMLRERSDADKSADYSPEKPVQIVRPVPVLKIEQAKWNDIVRKAFSAIRAAPGHRFVRRKLRAISSTYRLVNSEGTTIRVPEEFTDLQIRMSSLLPDGTVIWNHAFLTAERPDGLPMSSKSQRSSTMLPRRLMLCGALQWQKNTAALSCLKAKRRRNACPGSSRRIAPTAEAAYACE